MTGDPVSKAESAQNEMTETASHQKDAASAAEESTSVPSSNPVQAPPPPPLPPQEPIEYNPRWMGYAYILLASLVNFASCSNVPEVQRAAFWYLSIAFGVLTFCVSSLIILQDLLQPWIKLPDVIQAHEGYMEGYILCFMVLWWVVGVAYITRPGGIAYVASNIWFSAWLSLFACCHTLNEWSASKDLLSFEEIISVSPTLIWWWLHFFSACTVFGSCVDIIIRYNQRWDDFQDASFGLALGLMSMVLSFMMVLIHYDFLSACQCEEGGWTELFTSVFLILIWIIGLAILTQEGGIAGTMTGNQCIRHPGNIVPIDINCTVVVDETVLSCRDVPEQIPGSNLYFACWLCMLSIVAVAFKWKAAQALRFAQAEAERQQKKEEQQFGSDQSDKDYDDSGVDHD
jgi:hypothetical protein